MPEAVHRGGPEARRAGREQARVEAMRASQTLALERRSAEVEAFRAQMEAMHPELVATLKSLGHQQLASALTENLGPLAILGGESVVDVASRLLGALPVGSGGLDARDVLAHLDEPVADPGLLALYQVVKFSRESVKVVLSGNGGDEFYAGYAPFRALGAQRQRYATAC